MTDTPVSFENPRIGLREVCLLLIAAGFVALMIDEPKLAVVTGWAVVAIWAWAMTRSPRLSWTVSMVLGASLFVTTIWWTRDNWWHAAIALLWAGVAMFLIGLGGVLLQRFRRR